VKEVTCTGEGDSKMCNLCCNGQGNPKENVEVVKNGEQWLVKMESKDQFKKENGTGLEDLGNSLEQGLNELGNEVANGVNEAMENATTGTETETEGN